MTTRTKLIQGMVVVMGMMTVILITLASQMENSVLTSVYLSSPLFFLFWPREAAGDDADTYGFICILKLLVFCLRFLFFTPSRFHWHYNTTIIIIIITSPLQDKGISHHLTLLAVLVLLPATASALISSLQLIRLHSVTSSARDIRQQRTRGHGNST